MISMWRHGLETKPAIRTKPGNIDLRSFLRFGSSAIPRRDLESRHSFWRPSMKKSLALAALVAAGLMGPAVSTLAAPQDMRSEQSERPKLSPEDFAALTDARVAALKAGLKLTPDQEKSWPAVEAAIREGGTARKTNDDGSAASPKSARRRAPPKSPTLTAQRRNHELCVGYFGRNVALCGHALFYVVHAITTHCDGGPEASPPALG